MFKYLELSIYEKLLKLPLFQGLGSSEMSWIIEKIKFDFSKHAAGDVIIKQDSACNSVYFVLDGEVNMVTVSPDNDFTFYERISSPSVLQPEVLFGPRTRYTHSFVAVDQVGILCISKSEFWESLLQYEVFRMNYINMISAEAQNANRLLWLPANGSIRQRIIHFFAMHCWRPSGYKTVKIKMEALANQLCETRVNVSKELNELQDEGAIVLKRSIIVIPKMEVVIGLLNK